MKACKKVLFLVFIGLVSGLILSGCENTGVSGSVHYSTGYGYPWYYDPWHRDGDIIIVNPPGHSPERPGLPDKPPGVRPPKPSPKPMPRPPSRPKPRRR
jgi:hypothetical protein